MQLQPCVPPSVLAWNTFHFNERLGCICAQQTISPAGRPRRPRQGIPKATVTLTGVNRWPSIIWQQTNNTTHRTPYTPYTVLGCWTERIQISIRYEFCVAKPLCSLGAVLWFYRSSIKINYCNDCWVKQFLYGWLSLQTDDCYGVAADMSGEDR